LFFKKIKREGKGRIFLSLPNKPNVKRIVRRVVP
jgi:hypothetical protein